VAAARPERPVIWLQEGIRADKEAREARAMGLTVIQDLCIFKVHRHLGSGGA
jgi:predicted CoA-binding protein